MAPAEFIAGWLFGITTQADSERDEIMACYTPNADLTSDYYEGMAAFEANDQKTGTAKFNDAQQYYGDAFAKCSKKVTDPLTEYTNKVNDLSKIANWSKISA